MRYGRPERTVDVQVPAVSRARSERAEVWQRRKSTDGHHHVVGPYALFLAFGVPHGDTFAVVTQNCRAGPDVDSSRPQAVDNVPRHLGIEAGEESWLSFDERD
jgi:hypothetical protein